MPGFDRSVAKRLANEIRDRRVEVLHAHQYTPFFYAALARLVYRADCKILFTEHGRHYPDVVSSKRRWINRLLLQRYAEETTACCDFSTKALIEVEGFPHAKTLHNGVDVQSISNRPSSEEMERLRIRIGLDVGRPYAACVARFHPVKDHATAIRGWFRVHQELPEARLLLVGGGEEEAEIRSLISALAKESCEASGSPDSFTKSIQFLGVRDDVCDILRAVNVFTLTSVSEAASLTLLEAMGKRVSECGDRCGRQFRAFAARN